MVVMQIYQDKYYIIWKLDMRLCDREKVKSWSQNVAEKRHILIKYECEEILTNLIRRL